MSAPVTIKYDSPSNFTRPEQDGPRRTTYPFIRNGDRDSLIYQRDLVVSEAYYQPPKLGFARDSDWPGGDPWAYALKDPEELSYVGIGDLVRVPRRYARIPGRQVSYPGSRYFPLPSLTGDYGTGADLDTTTYPVISSVGKSTFSLSALAVHSAYNNSLFGPMKALTGRVIGRASGGTFTLTYGANTTAALNWNDSNATIAAAINGLASVSAAGLTASVLNSLNDATNGGTLTIAWTGAGTFTPLTMNAASLTTNTSTNTTTQIQSSAAQVIRLSDNYTATAHGLNTSLSLMRISTTDAAQIVSTGSWGSIDANTIWMSNSGTTAYSVYIGTSSRSYVAGKILLLRQRLTEDFALPGISNGISSPTDIPVVAGLQNPSDFINALLTQTGWQTYETEGPAFWLDGPIYRVGYTAINLDDIT